MKNQYTELPQSGKRRKKIEPCECNTCVDSGCLQIQRSEPVNMYGIKEHA